MKAIILAAGMGTRIRPLTNKCPKAFIEIENIPLIKKSLDNINSVGITEVLIVIGYMADYFKKNLGKNYRDIKLSYVINEDFSTTGSMFSLSKTEGIIEDNILLLESDLLYEKRALQILLESKEPNEILIAPLSGSGDEVFIVVNDENELINLGKNIINKNNAIGELVGISKLSFSFLQKLYKKANEDYDMKDFNQHYEEVIFKLSKTNPIKCRLIQDLNWIEIDNIDDLNRAKLNIFPQIKNKEQKI